jgi:hypothetical protein
MQSVAAVVWPVALAGALAAEVLPALRPATTYGKLSMRPALTAPRTGRSSGMASPGAPAVASTAARGIAAWPALERAVTIAQSVTVPKQAFTWFYAVGSVANLATLLWEHAAGALTQSDWMLLLLYQLHLARRLWECLFLHQFSKQARMPAAVWAAGILHYICVPSTLLSPCATAGGSLSQGSGTASRPGLSAAAEAALGQAAGAVVRVFLTTRLILMVVCGLVGFVVANITQHKVHRQLATLRPHGAREAASRQQGRRRGRGDEREVVQEDEEDDCAAGAAARPADDEQVRRMYPVPAGGLFTYALCPHYTAEVVIYASLLTLQQGCDSLFNDGAGWACAAAAPPLVHYAYILMMLWVAANLTVTARRTREWYVAAYPEERRLRYTAAIFPFAI